MSGRFAGLYAVPPGADFPAEVVAGLRARFAAAPPEALARVRLLLTSARMRDRVRAELAAAGPGLLPRLGLVAELPELFPHPDLPPPVPPLRRRLQLARLVGALIAAAPGLAPRAAVFDLAESLARLLDEMEGEGVAAAALAALDLGAHAEHWQRARAFLDIAAGFAADALGAGPERRLRVTAERLGRLWQQAPPDAAVIVAGSTGSRGATARLLAAVARLPRGAVILPGFDFDMPAAAWAALDDPLAADDHPQARFRRLMRALGVGAEAVRPWHGTAAPVPERARLVSVALRPAPVTDRWMEEGPRLRDLDRAAAGVALIEAPGPRAEALAVALRMRAAVAEGKTVALITPDRVLSRQVSAALDRWGIVPDDSGGRPLGLSAPGRFLRQIAALRHRVVSIEALLGLLKHPLCHSGGGRGPHLLHTRDLELHLRRHGPAFPDAAALAAWAGCHPAEGRAGWVAWLAGVLADLPAQTNEAAAHLAAIRALAERLAAGAGIPGAGALWDEAAGIAAAAAMAALEAEAPHAGPLDAADAAALLDAVLASAPAVREAAVPHPAVLIRGTLEARVQGAGVVILAGLNDGVWPPLPAPDPWLNRRMRAEAGLRLPERQVGLSTHDFQQAVNAPEVVLSRALRDAESETVPSRWLNRLVNLMGGLPAQGGPAALAAMRAAGRRWLTLAAALEEDWQPAAPAPRPAPAPPAPARPRELPVTEIARLIRDPYSVYARRVLGLRPLDPLRPVPDPRLRGIVVHRIMARFVAARGLLGTAAARAVAEALLLRIAAEELAASVPWPSARRLWLARLARVVAWFVATEAARDGTPVLAEQSGAVTLPDGFRLTARPDRIDELPGGALHILDYKTGAPPTRKQQAQFDKQLLLEAAMAVRGGFAGLGARAVARITYVGLGGTGSEVASDLAPDDIAAVWDGFARLVAAYARPDQGYGARRALFRATEASDYDHLSRFGEWEMTDRATAQPVGQGGGDDGA